MGGSDQLMGRLPGRRRSPAVVEYLPPGFAIALRTVLLPGNRGTTQRRMWRCQQCGCWWTPLALADRDAFARRHAARENHAHAVVVNTEASVDGRIALVNLLTLGAWQRARICGVDAGSPRSADELEDDATRARELLIPDDDLAATLEHGARALRVARQSKVALHLALEQTDTPESAAARARLWGTTRTGAGDAR